MVSWMTRRTGNEIINMIHKNHLEDVTCYFSIPEAAYRKSHYKRPCKLSDAEIAEMFDKRLEGETLSSLSKIYGLSTSRLSAICQRELIRRAEQNRSKSS